MNHKLYFRVELNSIESSYSFRGKYLNISFTNDNNPYMTFISDENGFLIWKSFDQRANEFYHILLSSNQINSDTFNFTNLGFTIIFFDKQKELLLCGKDRLGLSSLTFTQDPFIIASHDLVGSTEHSPGITIFTANEDDNQKISFPLYIRNEDTINHTIAVNDAIDGMINCLLRNVKPDFPVSFSGGLDSTVIAGILGLSGSKTVKLINFCATDNAPDRLAARASFEELKASFPNTNYELLEFTGNESSMFSELDLIKSILIPCEVTEMNLNIAMTLRSSLQNVDSFGVHSGLGADELLCGYMRMKKDSNANDEIAEHMNRLWTRNGGRDDRVAMDIGKILVCPFLSDEFINFALSLPVNFLIRTDLPRGEGEKWILRQVALKLGLQSAAKRPKQAMQFGSRVAKTNWRGTDKIPQS